ncbi:MAG: hypothetical protein ACRC17_05285 [Culicoidibacterales bacterium]
MLAITLIIAYFLKTDFVIENLAVFVAVFTIFLTPIINKEVEKRQFHIGVNVLHVYREQIVNDLENTSKKYYMLEAGFEKTRYEIEQKKADNIERKEEIKKYINKRIEDYNISVKWFGVSGYVSGVKINLYDITSGQRSHYPLRMFEISSEGSLIIPLPEDVMNGKYAIQIFYKDHLNNAYEFLYVYNQLGKLDSQQSYQKFNWKRKRKLNETANVLRLNGWIKDEDEKKISKIIELNAQIIEMENLFSCFNVSFIDL